MQFLRKVKKCTKKVHIINVEIRREHIIKPKRKHTGVWAKIKRTCRVYAGENITGKSPKL